MNVHERVAKAEEVWHKKWYSMKNYERAAFTLALRELEKDIKETHGDIAPLLEKVSSISSRMGVWPFLQLY